QSARYEPGGSRPDEQPLNNGESSTSSRTQSTAFDSDADEEQQPEPERQPEPTPPRAFGEGQSAAAGRADRRRYLREQMDQDRPVFPDFEDTEHNAQVRQALGLDDYRANVDLNLQSARYEPGGSRPDEQPLNNGESSTSSRTQSTEVDPAGERLIESVRSAQGPDPRNQSFVSESERDIYEGSPFTEDREATWRLHDELMASGGRYAGDFHTVQPLFQDLSVPLDEAEQELFDFVRSNGMDDTVAIHWREVMGSGPVLQARLYAGEAIFANWATTPDRAEERHNLLFHHGTRYADDLIAFSLEVERGATMEELTAWVTDRGMHADMAQAWYALHQLTTARATTQQTTREDDADQRETDEEQQQSAAARRADWQRYLREQMDQGRPIFHDFEDTEHNAQVHQLALGLDDYRAKFENFRYELPLFGLQESTHGPEANVLATELFGVSRDISHYWANMVHRIDQHLHERLLGNATYAGVFAEFRRRYAEEYIDRRRDGRDNAFTLLIDMELPSVIAHFWGDSLAPQLTEERALELEEALYAGDNLFVTSPMDPKDIHDLLLRHSPKYRGHFSYFVTTAERQRREGGLDPYAIVAEGKSVPPAIAQWWSTLLGSAEWPSYAREWDANRVAPEAEGLLQLLRGLSVPPHADGYASELERLIYTGEPVPDDEDAALDAHEQALHESPEYERDAILAVRLLNSRLPSDVVEQALVDFVTGRGMDVTVAHWWYANIGIAFESVSDMYREGDYVGGAVAPPYESDETEPAADDAAERRGEEQEDETAEIDAPPRYEPGDPTPYELATALDWDSLAQELDAMAPADLEILAALENAVDVLEVADFEAWLLASPQDAALDALVRDAVGIVQEAMGAPEVDGSRPDAAYKAAHSTHYWAIMSVADFLQTNTGLPPAVLSTNVQRFARTVGVAVGILPDTTGTVNAGSGALEHLRARVEELMELYPVRPLTREEVLARDP
ncbi:hypothetical protein, partial [Streptomyces sp. NPDC056632]|uniref:hypothetical protein n=1 Tax=Streptomyces sp. NPDC056632 TaxID=3345884 RepID=UPI003690A3A5